ALLSNKLVELVFSVESQGNPDLDFFICSAPAHVLPWNIGNFARRQDIACGRSRCRSLSGTRNRKHQGRYEAERRFGRFVRVRSHGGSKLSLLRRTILTRV